MVDRDRRILVLLADHKALTTNQIAALEFSSVRRAQARLRQLRQLGVVFAFRDSYSTGGTSQTRYALGYLGARLIAAQRSEKPPTPKTYAERLERLGLWPKLTHQLGVNDVFCMLAAYARQHPQSAARLTQWWSEKRCTEFFWNHSTKLRPDAYGCWEERGRWVRFFLEHDTGTEPLSKVTRKIIDYARFRTDEFGVLLFELHSGQREHNLRAALHRELSGTDPGFVIATASRDHGHLDGPAGPVWSLWSAHHGEPLTARHRLAELPQRGPQIARQCPLGGIPFNEAAFDPNDRAMTDKAMRGPSAVDDHQEDDLILYSDEPGDGGIVDWAV